jgi:hypothetical protein
VRWLSLFLACQQHSSGTNAHECEDQSWFKVQAVPAFSFNWYKTLSPTPWDVLACRRLKTTVVDNRLIDSCEFVCLAPRLLFTPRKVSGNHFCYRLKRPQDHGAAGRIRWIEKCSKFIRNRSRDLPICSVMSQATTLPLARKLHY